MPVHANDRPLTVVFIAHDFDPSIEVGARRATALARYLGSRGVRVIVVSEFGGAAIAEGTEIFPNVIAVPVPHPRRLLLDTAVALKGKLRAEAAPAANGARAVPATSSTSARPSVLGWFRDGFFDLAYVVDQCKRWSWRASSAAVRMGGRLGAGLVLSSGPPFSSLIGARRAARRLGVPHIVDLRDPWSDTAPADAVHPDGVPRSRLSRLLEHAVLSTSAAVTCTAEPLRQLLARRHPDRPVLLIRNGFDGDIRPARAGTAGCLNMLFAGETYVGRDPFPLLEAVERLVSRADVDGRRVRLTMAGRCGSYGGRSVAEWLRGRRAERVVDLLGQQPPAAVAKLIEQSTVLVNLAQRQPLQVPAKTYEHMTSGREMLIVSEPDSGTGRLVVGLTGANLVDPTDDAGLDAVLLDLYRRHVEAGQCAVPSEGQVAEFSRRASNEQFFRLMTSLVRN